MRRRGPPRDSNHAPLETRQISGSGGAGTIQPACCVYAGIEFIVDYAAHGVQEYWIIDLRWEFIEQHILQGKFYELRIEATDGPVHCTVIPDLSFPVRAIFDRFEGGAGVITEPEIK